jgi:hypothetical protein
MLCLVCDREGNVNPSEVVPSFATLAEKERRLMTVIISCENRHRGTLHLGQSFMSRTLATVIACGLLLGPTFANAQEKPDKAAVAQATATCRAEVKEHAKYNEMSLWAQHKAVKKCVADALAKH